MSRAARSVFVFSLYLFGLSLVLLVQPNFLLVLVGMPPASEPWIRVVGMLVGLLGYFYFNAARGGLDHFMRWTVNARCSVLLFFMAFVALGLAKPQLILLGLVDVCGALWTLFALRADAAHRLAA